MGTNCVSPQGGLYCFANLLGIKNDSIWLFCAPTCHHSSFIWLSAHPHTSAHRWSFLWACELVFIRIFTSDIFSHYQAETNPQPLFHHSRVAPAKDCIMDLVGLEDDVLLLELFFGNLFSFFSSCHTSFATRQTFVHDSIWDGAMLMISNGLQNPLASPIVH